MQPRLSILSEDTVYGAALASYLDNQGLSSEHLPCSRRFLARLQEAAPRMVLLSDLDGQGTLATLRRIRDVSRVPCVVITSRSDDVSQIVTLEAGADDVVTREMPMRAILARVRALLRRAEWAVGPQEAAEDASLAGWQLDVERRHLLRPDGTDCDLTSAEFDLMRLLMEARGNAVSRDTISQVVFRRQFRAEDRTVDNLVLRLRRKLGEDQQRTIKTVRGAGYMFAGFALPRARVA